MRKTYAYNSIIFGFLLGLGAFALTNSVILGVLAGIAVTVVGFVAIRLIENALYRGAEKLGEKVSEKYRQHKERTRM